MNKRTITKEFTCDNGYSVVSMHERGKELFGYIDRKGIQVIPFQFIVASNFRNGLALVAKRVKGQVAWGYIDKKGNEVVPIIYRHHPPLTPEGQVKGNQPLINMTRDPYRMINGLRIVVDKMGNVGFADEKGELVIPCQFEWVRDEGFNEDGICAVARWSEGEGVLMGVIDEAGREVVPIIYEDAGIISEEEADNDFCLKGRIVAKDKEGIYHVFEKNGKVVEACVQ